MGKVFIIGAGASYGHTNGDFPLINGFFKKAKDLKIISDDDEKIKNEYSDVKKYVKNVFNKDILKKEINIEEILTNLEIDIEKNSILELKIIRGKIIEIIRGTINKLSAKSYNENSEYFLFIKHLKDEDSIITFNWDLLLDDILGRKKCIEHALVNEKKQYENMFMKLTGNRRQTWAGMGLSPYVDYQTTGYYLKLHGSIDWAYCPNEDCGLYNEVFPVDNLTNQHSCTECSTESKFLIIPPVLNKKYNEFPFIKKIWNFAKKEVCVANELVIWGYGLPSTDFYSMWLLHQARGNLRNVSIINPVCFRRVKRKSGVIKFRKNMNFLRPFLDSVKHKTEKDKIKYYESFRDYYRGQDFLTKYNIK